MAKDVKCKYCKKLKNHWCKAVLDSPDEDLTRECRHFIHKTNADRIRAMSDEELKYIVRVVIRAKDCPMGETECTDCVLHDLCLRGDYYYYNEEEWLKQPVEES